MAPTQSIAFSLLQTALGECVRRVIICSSNHPADWYERLIRADEWDHLDPTMKTYSDNYHGRAKEAYEDLGFVFATGVENGGRHLENIQLRIGLPRETEMDKIDPRDLKRLHRCLGVCLSSRDKTQLFVQSKESPDIREAHGIPFQIVYGKSDNDHSLRNIANARHIIGYSLENNSAIKFADKIPRIIQEAQCTRYG